MENIILFKRGEISYVSETYDAKTIPLQISYDMGTLQVLICSPITIAKHLLQSVISKATLMSSNLR